MNCFTIIPRRIKFYTAGPLLGQDRILGDTIVRFDISHCVFWRFANGIIIQHQHICSFNRNKGRTSLSLSSKFDMDARKELHSQQDSDTRYKGRLALRSYEPDPVIAGQ